MGGLQLQGSGVNATPGRNMSDVQGRNLTPTVTGDGGAAARPKIQPLSSPQAEAATPTGGADGETQDDEPGVQY